MNTTPSGRSTPDFPGEIPPAHAWRITPGVSLEPAGWRRAAVEDAAAEDAARRVEAVFLFVPFGAEPLEDVEEARAVLGLVHGRVRRAVEDPVEPHARRRRRAGEPPERVGIADVHLAVGADVLQPARSQDGGQLRPEHALVSDEPDHEEIARE